MLFKNIEKIYKYTKHYYLCFNYLYIKQIAKLLSLKYNKGCLKKV